MCCALDPLLTETVGKLLPEIARASLGSIVLDALMPMAETLADAPVVMVLNPASRPAVEALIAEATGLPIVIEDEATLGEGQVYLRLGGAETCVDLDRATAEIMTALRGFFDLSNKET